MKNACIVLRNCKDSLSAVDFGCVADAFLSGGYAFSEIRILSSEEEKEFSDAFSALRAEAENLAVVLPSESLIAVGSRLAALLGAPCSRRTLSGAGIFEKGDFTLFLLAADKGEAGAEYVRGVCVPSWKGNTASVTTGWCCAPSGRSRKGSGACSRKQNA